MPKTSPQTSVPVLATDVQGACAALGGVSWEFFNEHVAPDLKIVRRGRKKLVALSEIQRWLDENSERVLDGAA